VEYICGEVFCGRGRAWQPHSPFMWHRLDAHTHTDTSTQNAKLLTVKSVRLRLAYKVFADAAASGSKDQVSRPSLPPTTLWRKGIRHYLHCTCQRHRTQKLVACNGGSSSAICSERDNLPAITKFPSHVCGSGRIRVPAGCGNWGDFAGGKCWCSCRLRVTAPTKLHWECWAKGCLVIPDNWNFCFETMPAISARTDLIWSCYGLIVNEPNLPADVTRIPIINYLCIYI